MISSFALTQWSHDTSMTLPPTLSLSMYFPQKLRDSSKNICDITHSWSAADDVILEQWHHQCSCCFSKYGEKQWETKPGVAVGFHVTSLTHSMTGLMTLAADSSVWDFPGSADLRFVDLVLSQWIFYDDLILCIFDGIKLFSWHRFLSEFLFHFYMFWKRKKKKRRRRSI